jgi:hypothetical protein
MSEPRNPGDCALLALTLSCGIGLAQTTAELNEFMRTHNDLIRQLHHDAPHLVAVLKAQTLKCRETLGLPETLGAAA